MISVNHISSFGSAFAGVVRCIAGFIPFRQVLVAPDDPYGGGVFSETTLMTR
jgi:hypothetical protein